MITTTLLALILTTSPSAAAALPAPGAQAPAFTVTDCQGAMVDTQALLAKGPLVLAFYPKAQTSGCTKEMRAFVQQADMLKKYKATVVAISADDALTLQKFKQDLGAQFSFVPDPDGALMKLYKSKMPILTIAKRKTFVINTQGTIVYVAEGSDAIALKGVEDALAKMVKASG